MLMFSLAPAYPFALALAEALDVSLSPHEERLFPDGECKLRPLVDPRGADAYVVHSLHGGPIDSPHDKLCRLLMFIATLKDLAHEHQNVVVGLVWPRVSMTLARARRHPRPRSWTNRPSSRTCTARRPRARIVTLCPQA